MTQLNVFMVTSNNFSILVFIDSIKVFDGADS